jgi:hypothetical protein
MANIVDIPQGGGTGSHLVSDSGYRSREPIVVAMGSGKLPPGTVLAQLTGGANIGKFVPVAEGGADGSAVFKAVLFEAVDTTAADVNVTGHVRDCELKRFAIGFVGTPSTAFKNAVYAAMSAVGIALR